MRILLHQDAVVERARLALVRIDAQINRPRMILGQKAPLGSGRETGAATTTQAGVFHDLRHIIGRHRERFAQRFVAAIGAIAGQRRAIRLIDATQKYRFKLRHVSNRRSRICKNSDASSYGRILANSATSHFFPINSSADSSVIFI